MEFGGGLGSMYYTGDLTHTVDFSQSHLAFSGVYRMNFSPELSFKLGLAYGKISGNDDKPIDVLGENRDFSFNHQLIEFSSVFEYHFLNYRDPNNVLPLAPYVFFGFGFTRITDPVPSYEDYNSTQPVLPMGAGVKYVFSKRFTITGEIGARKTWFDYLDGISDGDTYIKNYRYGNPNDNDWYFFTGIQLTYVLYKVPCPFPYVPNQSILNRIKAH